MMKQFLVFFLTISTAAASPANKSLKNAIKTAKEVINHNIRQTPEAGGCARGQGRRGRQGGTDRADWADRADSLRHDLTEISNTSSPRSTSASKNRGKQESVTLFINAVGSVAVARID